MVGAFFRLGVAFDLVDDPSVKAVASDVATRLIGFISRHQWSPNDDISSTFQLRPEELQTLLQVARHINPANTVSGPFLVARLLGLSRRRSGRLRLSFIWPIAGCWQVALFGRRLIRLRRRRSWSWRRLLL